MTEPTPAPAPVDETLARRVHAALRAVGEGDTDPGTGSDYGDQTAAVLAELAPELARAAQADIAHRDGAREAAAMLRRTPRDSRDYPAVLTGARVIEDWIDSALGASAPDERPPQ